MRALANADHRTQDQLRSHFCFLERMGVRLQTGAKVLDYGCGRGAAVRALLELGYDAYGVDVRPWWTSAPILEPTGRLRLINPETGSIPFPDSSFDLCFSDQVFEHIFDYTHVFREIGRILNPDAVSVHRFPGPNTLVDGHTHIPLPALCHSKLYLTAWAILGRRSPEQEGLDWRRTLASSLEIMGGVNYPTKRRLRHSAAAAGVSIEFLEAQELAMRDSGRASMARRYAERWKLGRLAVAGMSCFVQRYMLLKRAQ